MLETKRSSSILLLAFTAVLWSVGGVFIKLVDWNPMAIAAVRSTIASIVIFLYLKKPKFNWSKAQIGAALAYTATVIFFVSATKLTTAANAILLQFTAPVYVALLSGWFLKEKIRLIDWLLVLTVLGGMTMFFLDHLSLEGFYGNIIGAASGISFALFTIFMRMQKKESPVESVFLGNILTAIIGLPFIFHSGPGTTGWIYLLILGLFQLGIPFILYSMAIKHVAAIDAVLIQILEPLLNPLWVFLLLGEIPGPWALLGGVIVLSAVTTRYLIPILKNSRSKLKEEATFYHGD